MPFKSEAQPASWGCQSQTQKLHRRGDRSHDPHSPGETAKPGMRTGTRKGHLHTSRRSGRLTFFCRIPLRLIPKLSNTLASQRLQREHSYLHPKVFQHCPKRWTHKTSHVAFHMQPEVTLCADILRSTPNRLQHSVNNFYVH